MTVLVDKSRELPGAVERLGRAERLFLDTEFESSRAGTLLSLVQLSDGEEIYLIDALRLSDLSALAPAVSRPNVEWVVHAGLQDVGLLGERLGIRETPRLFDTQLAWGLTSAEQSVSLAYLKFRLLGLRSGKAHQADDWKRRPLPPSQLQYAAEDVEHLPALYAALVSRLAQHDRVEVAYRASQEALWPDVEPLAKLRLDDFRNAWQLDRNSQAGLRHLIEWYNGLSEVERNGAPDAKVLLSVAARLPETASDLGRIKGMPRRFVERHGDSFTGELMRATARASADDFEPIDPPPYATFEEARFDAWLGLARAEIAATLQMAPEILLPGRVLRRLRHEISDKRDLSAAAAALPGFRGELLPAPLAEFAARHPPPAIPG